MNGPAWPDSGVLVGANSLFFLCAHNWNYDKDSQFGQGSGTDLLQRGRTGRSLSSRRGLIPPRNFLQDGFGGSIGVLADTGWPIMRTGH
jgi:hypothetical protein